MHRVVGCNVRHQEHPGRRAAARVLVLQGDIRSQDEAVRVQAGVSLLLHSVPAAGLAGGASAGVLASKRLIYINPYMWPLMLEVVRRRKELVRSLEPFEDSVIDLGNLPRVRAGVVDIKHPRAQVPYDAATADRWCMATGDWVGADGAGWVRRVCGKVARGRPRPEIKFFSV